MPLPDEVVERICTDDADTRDLVAGVADDAFRTILYGDDEERAVRLLRSIPGIRGERPDADR